MTPGTKSPVSPVANHADRRRALISGQGVAVLFVLAFAAFGFARYGSVTKTALGPEQVQCDTGISAASREQVKAVSDVGGAPASALNAASSPEVAPQGMVWVPGGEFWMGSNEPSFGDAHPWHKVNVDGFWMDKTEVTNADFARFVKATGYITVAERTPRAEDYPATPTENLIAGSVVFTPPDHPVELNNNFQWWSYAQGANWRHPEGSPSDIHRKENHPVVHIAYEDALAYSNWAGKRLPTEAEYEFAERGGLDRKPYAWGDEFRPNGKFMANIFQGHFPDKNTGEDGYLTTAPVASFPPNGYGLYDLSGNVWEWTSDWYRPDYYQSLAEGGGVTRNPQGPSDSFDPSEPGIAKRVHRGGSFLCSDQYCSRYKVGGRGKGAPDTGTNHLGFRCVKEAPVKAGSNG